MQAVQQGLFYVMNLNLLIAYLIEIRDGKHKEANMLMDVIIEHALNCPFEDRHKPINVIINRAINK